MAISQRSESSSTPAHYELQFDMLVDPGRALAFECDECGVVNMDALSARARNNYFRARALLGRDYAYPVVRAFRPLDRN